MAEPFNQKASWKDYFEKTKSLPPRTLLINALTFVGSPKEGNSLHQKSAIDFGCGAGRDTVELLKLGWQVTAIDSQSAAFEYLRELAKDFENRVNFVECAFENLDALPSVQLFYASLSLPFCPPEAFSELFLKIRKAIQPKGIFAANFFGGDDDWVKGKKVLGHNEVEIRRLLDGFEVLQFGEENRMGKTRLGTDKRWHVYSVIARAP